MIPNKELDEQISIAIARREARDEIVEAQQAARIRITIKYAPEIELDPESNIESLQQAGE